MLEKLESLENRYLELEALLSDPAVIGQQSVWREHSRELASLSEIMEPYRRYKKVTSDLKDAAELLKESRDSEMVNFLKEEMGKLNKEKEALEKKLKELLIPKDPMDEKNVFIEIRAARREEAALFAADLLKMYTQYAEQRGWKIEIVDAHPTDIGGFKEVIVGVAGKGATAVLNTRAVSTACSAFRRPSREARSIPLPPPWAYCPRLKRWKWKSIPRICVSIPFAPPARAGRANTTQSAVRITHLPTGIVVSCQDEKSQLKNKEKAMRVLRSRLMDKYLAEQAAEMAETRRAQVGSGDRSERIRTYNFPQNRVTDHRISLTLHKLDQVLAGDLDEIIEQLIASARAEQLRATGTK